MACDKFNITIGGDDVAKGSECFTLARIGWMSNKSLNLIPAFRINKK